MLLVGGAAANTLLALANLQPAAAAGGTTLQSAALGALAVLGVSTATGCGGDFFRERAISIYINA